MKGNDRRAPAVKGTPIDPSSACTPCQAELVPQCGRRRRSIMSDGISVFIGLWVTLGLSQCEGMAMAMSLRPKGSGAAARDEACAPIERVGRTDRPPRDIEGIKACAAYVPVERGQQLHKLVEAKERRRPVQIRIVPCRSISGLTARELVGSSHTEVKDRHFIAQMRVCVQVVPLMKSPARSVSTRATFAAAARATLPSVSTDERTSACARTSA